MKRFLLQLSAALLVLAGAGSHAFAQSITITSLGAHSDGSNATATKNAFVQAFQNYPNGQIIVPPGVYAIDNTAGPIWAYNFNGELDFQGGAVLVMQYNQQTGIHFSGGTGARIYNLHGNYATPPTARTQDEFDFDSMTDLYMSGGIAQNAPGIGFLLTQCIRPKLVNMSVTNTWADGLAFANCQDASLTNYTAINTYDNGLAFYNYGYMANYNGATVRNIRVNSSTAHGIGVLGTSDVLVSGFYIDMTTGSAIWVGQDVNYQSRVSSNCIFQHGNIVNAGQLPPTVTNAYGLEYTSADNILFTDIKIVNSLSRAVAGTSPTGHIFYRDVKVQGNQTNDAFVFNATYEVQVASSSSEFSPNNGFSFDGVTFAMVHDLKVVDSGASSSLQRAFWFQNGSYVLASNIDIVDDRGNPTGFNVGVSDGGGHTEYGSVMGVTSSILNGHLGVSPSILSPGVTWMNAN